MLKKNSKRIVALFLAVLMVAVIVPIQIPVEAEVTEYNGFMTKFKQLEKYADEYATMIVGRDPGELVLNFIRTGVERYQDDNWTTLAGQEIVGFTNYVKDQDAKANDNAEGYETNVDGVMDLRDIVIEDFKLPNGNSVDFGHMFGCMNISYVNKGSADLSGWAGDLCDLLYYCARDTIVPAGTIDEMAAYIQENCFGVNASEAFGWDDFWGDLDAYYLVTEYQKAGGAVKFSAIMDAYFTADLDDTARTVYFMNNRFAVADSREAVRKAVFDAYSADVGVKILESKRGISSYNALREACCYAIADYIYDNAKGLLVEGSGSGETATNGYYSVFSDTESILAPGITQNIKYAQTVDGKQIVYYVATVDVTKDDVMIMVNYKDNDPSKGWGMQTVADQVDALVNNYKDKYEYFTPVVATNGDGYNIYNGTPGGLLVMDGKEWHGVDKDGFFAILKDGSAMIGTQAEYEVYKDQIKEAIGGFGAVLVKDGKINVTKNANYTASRASRTAVGITAEGKVVMMVLDGRQQPFSAGGAMEEIAQIMLEAGCVHAINLDGGGSTTFLSKPAGSDKIGLTNRPSDGYQRMVAASLVAISTAKPSTEFEKAIISSDYEYITAGTSMQFKVQGVSNTGNAATIPEGAYWRVTDETLATIDSETGLFTANYSEEEPVLGEVTVEFVVNNEVVGSKVINIVIPDGIKFSEDRITAIYGQDKELLLTLWYEGKPVAFNTKSDVIIGFLNSSYEQIDPPGGLEGLTFTADKASGMRTVLVVGVLMANTEVGSVATLNLYDKGEATFDFNNATSGNRSLAWLREIENARSTDNKLYRIIDPTRPIDIDYTFALDMSAIEMPAQLEPLKSMLPDGTNPDAAAWDFMLSLAERICVQTSVTIRVELSPELNVDVSELAIITDYFELTSVNLDENNVLTVVCNWKDQTQAINPSTANPLCILNGISATVKDTASYFNNEVVITNNGTVTYDIYLATSALHSFASNVENQKQFGLYPYEHSDEQYPEGCRGDDHDTGGHFSSQYLDFADVYVVNKEIRQGWQEEGGEYYFFIDNEPVTGTQLVTDRHDANKMRFYEFDEVGKLVNENGASGLIWLGEDLYYAVLGEAQTGWQVIEDNNYYFDPDTGKAVDGEYTIRESKNSWQTGNFKYTFENHILVKGVWEYDTYQGKSGWRYRWAGDWKKACWFEVDGDTYHVTKNYPYYVTTGYAYYIKNYPSESDTRCYLFDDRGVLQKNYIGPATVVENGVEKTLFFKNGIKYVPGFFGSEWSKGLIQGTDGYYYFVNNDGSVFLGEEDGSSKWVGIDTTGADWTGGFVTANKNYTFDAYGRMTTDLLTGKVDITDATSKPAEDEGETVSQIITQVIGRVLSVKAEITCKVMYRDAEGKSHVIEAKVNPYAVSTFSVRSAAAEYNFAVPQDAEEVKIIVAGDMTGDGEITQEDVNHLRKGILGTGAELTEEQKIACDTNGDGKLSAVDVLLLQAAQAGKKPLDW